MSDPRPSTPSAPEPHPDDGEAGTNGSSDKQRFVLVLFQDPNFGMRDGNIWPDLVGQLRRECEDEILVPRERVELDVWLESPGGDAHAAYKLALLLRSYAHRVRVVVPDYAKSAATLLSLAADEIYMAPAAELGPLDAQIPREGGIVTTISALDIARSVQDLAQTAFDLALEGGADVLRETKLTRKESLSMMLDFTAKFMEPVVRQLDPTLIHWSSTLLAVASEYARRLLDMREAGAGPIAGVHTAFVANYPTHGFVISPEEGLSLGLPIRELSTYEYSKEATTLHRSFEDQRRNDVRLLSVDELAQLTPSPGGSAP